MSRGLAVAQVLVGTALFGTVGTARALGPDASGAAVGGARALLAALLLVPLAAWAGQSWRAALRRRSVWTAGLAQAGFQACFLSAVLLTGVATGTLLAIGSAPLFAGLLHRRVDRRWAAATSVGVAGLVLLVVGGDGLSVDVLGVLLALGAGFSYAAWTVATGRAVATGTGPVAASAGTFVVTAAVLLPALVLGGTGWLSVPSGWLLVVWLAVFPTVVSYVLLARGLGSLAPPVVATLGLTEPVVATLLAVLVLGEQLTDVAWLGAALVVAGLAATALVAARPAAAVGRAAAR